MEKGIALIRNHIYIIFFAPLLFIYSCDEERFGACERKIIYPNRVEYACFDDMEVGEGYGCESDPDNIGVFHEGTTCPELGYSINRGGNFWSASMDFLTAGANGNWGSGGSGGGSGGTYPFTFTCEFTGTSHTVDIPIGNCQTEYENYAKVYGCNEIDNFYQACVDLYGCLGQDVASLCQ